MTHLKFTSQINVYHFYFSFLLLVHQFQYVSIPIFQHFTSTFLLFQCFLHCFSRRKHVTYRRHRAEAGWSAACSSWSPCSAICRLVARQWQSQAIPRIRGPKNATDTENATLSSGAFFTVDSSKNLRI